ncbi:histone-lysine N-methyltransferase SUV39H2-like [Myzus persicae]|uniref:histone-lysine N-methyltransferase SUV39H2-like n=1 Tax=Myzus persicae TaxID=13164 RepID=UPI000B93961E|nr:histone-lysine N-methyltransferase SUV39H2-like [Myzus persicae]
MSDNLPSTKLVEQDTMNLNISDPTCSFEVIGPQTTINDDSNYDNIQNSACSKTMAVKTGNQKSECDIISSKNKNIRCSEENLNHNDSTMREVLFSDGNSLEMNDILSDDNDSDWEDIDDNDGDNNDNVLLCDDKGLENMHYNNDPNFLIDDSDWEDIDDDHDSVFLSDVNSLKNNDDHNDAAILSDDNDSDWEDIDDSDWEDIDDSDCADDNIVSISNGSRSENIEASSNNTQNDSPIDPILSTLNFEQAKVYNYMNSNPKIQSLIYERSCDDTIVMYNSDEILEILEARRVLGGKSFFLVKWKNWSVGFNTWECYAALHKSQQHIIDCFDKKRVFKTPINIMHLMLNRHIITELFEAFRTPTGLSFPSYSLDCVSHLLNTLEYPEHDETLRKKFIRSYLSTISLDFFRQLQFQSLRQWEIDINVISINFNGQNIKVENNMDLEEPPNSFVYIPNCTTEAKIIVPGNPPSGCLCKKACQSSTDYCNKISHAYDMYKKLIVFSDCPIFECNKECKCMSSCINRVVQHGSNVKVCIYKSRFPGWALKSYETIEKGQFVGIYAGEIITVKEYNQRLQNSSSSIDYTWEIDFNDTNNFKCVVDSTHYGNFTRFINHSCEANLSMHTVWIDCLGSYFPQLALFAKRNIFAGEQLTIDYFIRRSKDSLKESGIKCQCEMKNCKGYYF